MKKLFILLFFPLYSLFAQPVNNHVGQVGLPTPEAAAIGKFGDVPVDYFSGLASNNIPLHTIKAGPIQLNISLSHHFGGLKVAETSSWVGLGWALQYGGMISRTIQGIEDELAGGYYWQGASTTDNGTCIANPNYAQPTNAMANGQLDGEPDIFSYNVGGFSGKFYINADHVVVKIPENDLKIEYSIGAGLSNVYNLSQFIITLPDGTKYYYGKNPANVTAIEITRVNQSAFWSASTWKLMKISSFDDNYSIDLSYTNETYSFGVRNKNTGLFGSNNNNYDKIEVFGNRISSITSSTGRDILNFFPKATTREDLFSPISGTSTAYALDRLEINQGSYCKKFVFGSSYTLDNTANATGLDNENKKRLILYNVQEKSCDNAVTIPAYNFEYDITGNYLPHKTSAATDHWGFFNGAENNKTFLYNIPTTALSYNNGSQNIVDVQGGADKTAQFNHSKQGSLTKITYPTGGFSQFEYESNQVYDTLNTTTKTYLPFTANRSSCSNITTDYDEFITSLPNANDTYFELTVNGLTGNFCCPANTSKYANFIILQGTNTISTQLTYISCDQSTTIRGRLPSSLQNGVNYTFRVNPFYASASLKLFTVVTNTTYQNINVGGLRIKKITHHDGIAAANNIVKNYTYASNNISTQSSGVLYNKPTYGFVKTINNSCNFFGNTFTTHFFFDLPPIPLASFEGYTIGYQTVKESTAGAGYKKFNYYAPTIAPINSLPFGPPQPNITSGNLESESSNLPSNAAVAYSYNTSKTETLTNNTKPLIKCFWAKGGGGTGDLIGIFKNYPISTRPYRLESVENHKDGLSTNTSFVYRSDKAHLLPTQIETTHPDGTVEKEIIKYAKDLDNTDLLDKHMIHIPLEKTSFTDNIATGGIKTDYSLFNNFPRPDSVQSYNTELSTWETEAKYNSYDSKGNPSSVTMRGWDPETYTWSNDLMTQKKFLDFQWDYTYKASTALVDTYTEPNGLATSYDYDALTRLETANKYSGKSITTMGYSYATANNEISITTNNATGADFSTKKTLDGLGRNIKINKVGYGHGNLDVVTKIDYDPAGRIKKEYLPGFNTAGAATEYFYEDSPLSRATSISKPAPLGIETIIYGNDGNDHTQTVTNSLAEYNKTYTDTRGRTIKTISGKNSLTNTTNYVYDDRDNLLQVLPDGRSSADLNHIYSYTYNGRNQQLTKKIPEKALIEMRYNSRDLASHQKDGIQPVIYTEYDSYGREIKSGTTTSLTTTNFINVLSETEYKTAAGLGFGQAYKTKFGLFGANGLPNGQFIQSETTSFDSYHRPTNFISNHILAIANLSSVSSTIGYNALDQATSQTETINVAGTNYTTSQTYSYDHSGRRNKTEMTFDGTTKTLDETTAFDALDKPITMKVGGDLQTINYSYLPSGFLDKINGGSTGAGGIGLISNAVPSINSNTDLFAMDLDYAANGNISQAIQQNRGFVAQTNSYQYDGLHRLTNATNGTQTQAYTYKDVLGNIQTINRTDLVKENGNWTSKTIDNLTYSYASTLSNKISSIADASNNPMGYKPNSGTYSFDDNGNRTFDPANGTTATNNYLNLPSKFTKPDNSKLEIIYDASGRKWQEIDYNSNNIQVGQKNYIGTMEFEGNVINQIFHSHGLIKNLKSVEYIGSSGNGDIQATSITSTQKITEGKYEAENLVDLLPSFEALPGDKFTAQINPITSNFQWQYTLSDHLGNIRVLFTDKNGDGLIQQNSDENINEVLSFRNYSPFGLELGGSHKNLGTQNKYKFGGNEENGFTGYQDLGGRWRDNFVGAGFLSIDPMAEANEFYSPYIFAANDPISNIDFLGLTDIGINGGEGDDSNDKLIPKQLLEVEVKGKKNNSELLNQIQTVLDVGGWIPGVQTVAGLANAGIDAYRGNYGSALMNLGSSIPVAGYLFKGAKIAKVVSGVAKMKAVKAAIALTYRAMPTISGMHKHHVIPGKLLTDPGDLGKALRASGFNGQAVEFIRYVEKGFHGNHPAYTEFVAKQLEGIIRSNGGNLSIQDIKGVVNNMHNIIDKAQDSYKATGINLNDFVKQFKL